MVGSRARGEACQMNESTAPSPVRRSPRRRRRALLVTGITVGVVVASGGVAFAAAWQSFAVDTTGDVDFARPLAIPPLAESRVIDDARVFTLDVQEGAPDPASGVAGDTAGVNAGHLAPTLRATRGETVRMEVTNSLDEATTLHWHGHHLPAEADGGPHQMVAPGATWTPSWTIDQPAATTWYHPHVHGTTAEQVRRGVYGMFILDDEDTPAGLPSEYGVDDVPVMVQDVALDGDRRLAQPSNLIAPAGPLGDTLLVNGTLGPYLDVTTETVRLRLLNASAARVYDFGFDDDRDFSMIASDGGLLPAPHVTDRLRLSPGERAEIVVEVEPGESPVLRSYPPDLGLSSITGRVQGGADSFDVLQLRAAGELASSPDLPPDLAPAPDLDPADAVRTRTFLLETPQINGQAMDMERIDEVVTVGDTEIWEITNAGGAHNFHVHDVQFRVLDVGGEAPGPELSGWKDTVYLGSGETVRLVMRFEDYTDPDTPYMFHCHLLAHHDDGMMGQFVVVEPGQAPEPVDHSAHAHG
jgi:FtsP/CotA-like multicopper oxidase with cupredoxin domain